MLVKDALVENPLVVPPDTTFLDFIDTVLGSNQTTGAVAVGEKIYGTVSVHDVFRKIIPHYVDMDSHLMDVLHEGYFAEKFAKLQHTTVADLMNTQIDSVKPDDVVIKAVAMLVHKRRKSLPVIDGDRFLGMVTRRSLLRLVARCAN